MIIFCDIDWTLADCSHRMVTFDGKLWRAGVDEFEENLIDWDVFNEPERMLSDPVFDGAHVALSTLADEGHELVYVTSRERKTHQTTMEWLWKNGFPYGKLFSCTPTGGAPVFGKEKAIKTYAADIKRVGAAMYDDDWSGELQPVADKYNIKLLKPDYVLGKTGYWKKEIQRLKAANWTP